VPYLSALEVCSREGAIQIHVYLTLPYLIFIVMHNRSQVFQLKVWQLIFTKTLVIVDLYVHFIIAFLVPPYALSRINSCNSKYFLPFEWRSCYRTL